MFRIAKRLLNYLPITPLPPFASTDALAAVLFLILWSPWLFVIFLLPKPVRAMPAPVLAAVAPLQVIFGRKNHEAVFVEVKIFRGERG